MSVPYFQSLRACHSCGLIQELPALGPRERARCVRCQHAFATEEERRKSIGRCAAAAAGAFFLFWPAVLLPVLRIHQLGHTSESSIFGGTVELLRHGDYFVGSVVLFFSIIFPLVKMVLLLELCLLRLLHERHQALTYRILEHTGKWSMLDVLLLAFLVMLVKVGKLVSFEFGPAVLAFALCVVMNMIASLCFDPELLWDERQAARSPEPAP